MGRRSSFFGGSDDKALWRAAHKLDDARVRELLLKDPTTPQLNQPHPSKGTTPLMAACKRSKHGGGALVVQHLLEFGADLDVTDLSHHRNTALHYAAYADAATACEYLLHAGANAFALNHKGQTPLDVARLRGRKQAAGVLTQYLRIKSGWLDVNSNPLMPFWKHRWCVVLACTADRTRFEVCLFDDPGNMQPEQVLHIDPASRAECVAQSSSMLASWTDKPFMFALDRQVTFQSVRGARFTRDAATGLTHGRGSAAAKRVLFAAESELARREWMAQLANGAHLAPTPAVFQEPYANYPGTLFAAPSTWPSSMVSPLLPQHQPMAPAFDLYDITNSPATYGGAEHGHSNFSPPPRHHLDSPTTLVSAFASSVSVAAYTPPSAPSFSSSASERGFYHGPGTFVDSLEASSETSEAFASDSTSTFAARRSSGADAASSSLENRQPNQLLPDATAATDATSETPAKAGGGNSDCVICMDAVRDAICVPCGHIAGCHSCLSAIKRQSGARTTCPICRSLVHSVVKIYEC
ncbi:hypothetical protein PybrP1_008475 [[Pythium] brassicae (nom. inval.)]|nr:hypothetical protein PybrP1_008475 [[Pythium] brassicae (nom. inval.)]